MRIRVSTTAPRLGLASLLLVAAFAPAGCGSVSEQPLAPAEPFAGLAFEPTAGRVGYRFETSLVFPTESLPPGGISGQCGLTSDTWDYKGNLPPGIAAQSNSPSFFSGTPRQPGAWTILVNLMGVRCSMGPNQHSYGDRTLRVTFLIEP